MRKIVVSSIRRLIVCALCLWGIAESLFGLSQVVGLTDSRHPMFAMTGHFDNPGPYGGFVACITAVAAMYVLRNRKNVYTLVDKLAMYASVTAVICGMLVIPASMSRSAWFGLLVSLLIVLLTDRSCRSWIHRHILLAGCLAVICVALSVGAFFLKRDSAIGRLHIWHIDALAIAEAPFAGHGRNFVMGAYGRAQEQYFRARLDDGKVSETRVRVAGCPEYPFNEYLGMGMACGIPAMLLLLAATILVAVNLWRNDSPMAAGYTALALFAFGSYPFSIWRFWALLGAFVTGCGLNFPHRKRLSDLMDVMLPLALLALVSFIGVNNLKEVGSDREESFRALYEEGYLLHCAGELENSNDVLKEGAEKSSDPMFHVIIGKNYEAMEQYAEAETEYLKARYMVPCRIYPLVRLMRLQIRTGRNEDALQTARTIAGVPVNERILSMVNLKEESRKTLDSLSLVLDYGQ